MFAYFQLQGNVVSFLILMLQPLFFYLFRFFKQSFLFTWFCSCLSLIFMTIYKSYILSSEYTNSNKYHIHLFIVSMFWINLKCTSFYLENSNSVHFLNLVSYCFYPPTFFTGPFICYQNYKSIFDVSNQNQARVRKLITNVLWCILWYTFGNVCLHFIYVNVTAFYPEVSSNMWDILIKQCFNL